MRDGRLVRWVSFKKKNYRPKHDSGIGLIPLGDRKRYKEFADGFQERMSDKTRMYLR